jgi:hypothetical protein
MRTDNGIPPAQACDGWTERSASFVEWFETWASSGEPEREAMLDELPNVSARVHAFRDESNALIAQVGARASALGISVQPILDFLDALDSQFERLPDFREAFPVHGSYPLALARHKAIRVIQALLTASAQATLTEDESKWAAASLCSAIEVWSYFGGKPPGSIDQLERLKRDEDIVDFRPAGKQFRVIMQPSDKGPFRDHLEKRRANDNRGGARTPKPKVKVKQTKAKRSKTK